jgi:hypothetical protein
MSAIIQPPASGKCINPAGDLVAPGRRGVRFAAVLGGLVAGSVALMAQITVEVSLDQEQYLAGEQMIAAVKITNFSGRTLRLGADSSWLKFAVEADSGRAVERLSDPAVLEEFDLPSSSKGTRRADLAPCFDLTHPGRYRVTATLRVPPGDTEILSKPQALNVISGARVWEQLFGLPQASAPNAADTEVRKYILLATTSQKQSRLYVRITDEREARLFRVFPLGPLISFSRPEAQVDKNGQLHVLFQTGARAFGYSVVRPDGELQVREIYQYSTSRPSLRADAEGTITVAGGVRMFTAADLPKPAAAEGSAPGSPSHDRPSRISPKAQ